MPGDKAQGPLAIVREVLKSRAEPRAQSPGKADKFKVYCRHLCSRHRSRCKTKLQISAVFPLCTVVKVIARIVAYRRHTGGIRVTHFTLPIFSECWSLVSASPLTHQLFHLQGSESNWRYSWLGSGAPAMDRGPHGGTHLCRF